MDTFRYLLALLTVVAFLPAFGFWFLIHPFAHQWRRIGRGWAYACAAGPALGLMMLLWSAREVLVGPDLGFEPWLALIWAPLLFVAGAISMGVRRELPIATQAGLPELAPEGEGGELITRGIYARMRHPRYVAGTLGFLSWALIANYVGPYVFFLLFLPLIHGVVVLEDRELRDRFGREHEEYCRRVPRYWPRFGSLSAGTAHG